MTEREPLLEQWDERKLFKQWIESAQQGLVGLEHYQRLPQSFTIARFNDACAELAAHTRQQNKEFALMPQYHPQRGEIMLDPAQTIASTTHDAVVLDYNFGFRDIDTSTIPAADQIILRKIMAGEQQRANTPTSIRDLFLDGGVDGHVARKYARRATGSVHTHPSGATFSPDDFGIFLIEANAPINILVKPDGSAEALVLSRQTPLMSAGDISSNTAKQMEQIKQRIASVMRENPGTDLPDTVKRAMTAMIRTLSKRYSMGYYASAADSAGQFQRLV